MQIEVLSLREEDLVMEACVGNMHTFGSSILSLVASVYLPLHLILLISCTYFEALFQLIHVMDLTKLKFVYIAHLRCCV